MNGFWDLTFKQNPKGLLNKTGRMRFLEPGFAGAFGCSCHYSACSYWVQRLVIENHYCLLKIVRPAKKCDF